MKQKSLMLALSLSITCPGWVSYTYSNDLITLEQVSPLIDGVFINADTIELLHTFINKMNAYVYGVKEKNKMVGHYIMNGTNYSIPEIIKHEVSLKHHKDYIPVLKQAKKELITLAKQFFSHSAQAKPMIIRLIEEDCKKRNRPNSILLHLSKVPNGQEDAVFGDLVTDFAQLYDFCTDLTNFIHDFVHSCPKAQHLLKDRYAKLNNVKNHLDSVAHMLGITIDAKTEKSFLTHIKQKHIDKLTMHEITSDRIAQLFVSFKG